MCGAQLKAVLGGKFTVLNTYIRKEESQASNQSSCLKKLEEGG